LGGEERNSSATVTYNMNILQQIDSPQTFCVTLNGESKIAPERILVTYEYDHPVFTIDRAAAQGRHQELCNVNNTSFCGAYWGNGFHEDGVVSALAVVKALAEPTDCTASTKNDVQSKDEAVDANLQGTRP
jgi:predicted NAD/FAD-binding protein